MLVTDLRQRSMADPAAKPPCAPPQPGPERPQVPVPVPVDPPPNWTRQAFARTIAPWYLPLGAMTLLVGGATGAVQGYGTWLDAVTAASAASSDAAASVAILDHRGRLYLRTVAVAPPGNAFGRPVPYVLGARGEHTIHFRSDAVRGIVQGERVVARGDCLHDRVDIPAPRRDR